MNGQGNGQNWFRSMALTILIVAGGLYLAAQMIRAVATVLIVCLSVGGAIYLLAQIERWRRSKW